MLRIQLKTATLLILSIPPLVAHSKYNVPQGLLHFIVTLFFPCFYLSSMICLQSLQRVAVVSLTDRNSIHKNFNALNYYG